MLRAVLAVALVALPVVAFGQQDLLERLEPTTMGRHTGDDDAKVKASARIIPAAAGKPARLVVTADIADGWHIFSITQKPGGPVPTKLKIQPPDDVKLLGDFVADPPPEKRNYPEWRDLTVEEHKGRVTWEAPVQITPGVTKINGAVYAQVCAQSCLFPTDYPFSAEVPPGSSAQFPAETESVRREAGGTTVLDPSLTARPATAPPPAASGPSAASLLAILASAFVGGLLLNLMPCVLPVIGLKMFSFMEQAGESRRRVLTLNLWYTLGLLSVFLALATLAVAADLGLRDQNLDWGEQFSSTTFNIAMAALVFVMALSFLGVWDIPIPGFVGSGKAAQLATREGAIGAFAKGAMSTVLATPCSGPFLGPVFGFTLSQPVGITYLIFLCVGLGMASPYLLIGMFPRLIRFLPKPGAWMDTFKQIMGFLLLGTVVFIFTFLKKDYVVPTFAFLIGLWFACWLIGRTPITAPTTRKIRAWAGAAAVAGAVGLFAFTMLTPGDQLLPWKPFSRDELTRLTSQGKTVMVDFTADWCLTCKVNLKLAVNTHDVLAEVRKNNVVPLLADWTDGSSEIKDVLASLGSRSIPVLAIYPADRPHAPIVLRDVISKAEIVAALREAGPSRPNRIAESASRMSDLRPTDLNSTPPLAPPR